MMRHTVTIGTAVLALLSGFLLSCANVGIGKTPPGQGPQCGPDDRVILNLRGGVPASSILSAAQEMAVGHLVISKQGGLCMGTLIAGRWVLTAKHCTNAENDAGQEVPSTEVTSGMSFTIGPATGTSDPSYPPFGVVSIRFASSDPDVHNGSDLALVELDRDVLAEHPDVQPIGLMKTKIDSQTWNRYVGNNALAGRFEAVGRGPSLSGRQFLVTGVDQTSKNFIRTVRQLDNSSGVCGGDSGGPLIFRDADGLGRIAGTLFGELISFDADDCNDFDSYNRVDLSHNHRQWVHDTVCGEGSDGSCIGVINTCFGSADIERINGTADGSSGNKRQLELFQSGFIHRMEGCVSPRLHRYCSDDQTLVRECPPETVCGWSRNHNKWDCISPETDPCRLPNGTHVTREGICTSDNKAVWCDYDNSDGIKGARLHEQDCGSCGRRCGPVEGVGIGCI